MADLKNPFGLRDDNIVMIEDISLNERGQKCNCVCPSCKNQFIAKLGEIRTHHFAHSGEGCDEEIAYLTGLYDLIREFVHATSIRLPELILYWSCYTTPFTAQNFYDRIRFSDNDHSLNRTVAMQSKSVKYDTAEIVFHGKRPKALLLEFQSRQMALIIKPPATVCKVFSAEPYDNLATIELDTSGVPFGKLKKDQILDLLNERFHTCKWLYSPMAIRAIDKINEENTAQIEAMRKQQEYMKQTRLKRKQAAETLYNSYTLGPHEPKTAVRKAPLDEEKLRKGKQEVIHRFTQQKRAIYDSYGQRWIKCRKCNEIKPIEEYGNYDYGGPGKVNSGICRVCLESSN